MYNLYAIFAKYLDICKRFVGNLVSEHGNASRVSVVPYLISRRLFNDRRKKTGSLCEGIRKKIADVIDRGENFFCVDFKPIEVCRIALSLNSLTALPV